MQILKTETELDEIDNIKTQGLITRSQVRWHEKGEKRPNVFLILKRIIILAKL